MQQDARHRFLSTRLVDLFSVAHPSFSSSVVDTFLADDANLSVVTAFLNGETPPHLYLTYSASNEARDNDASGADGPRGATLSCSTGDGVDLSASSRLVYVLRRVNSTSGAVSLRDADINNELLFGVLEGPLAGAVESVIRDLFLPVFSRSRMWGKATPPQAKAFQTTLSRFADAVGELVGGQPPPPEVPMPDRRTLDLLLPGGVDGGAGKPVAWNKLASDGRLVQACEVLVQRWVALCEEVVAEGREVGRDGTIPTLPEEVGPLNEIEHWKFRHTRLDSMYAALHGPKPQAVLDFLTRVQSPVLQMWAAADSLVAEGISEAKESLKSLALLDKYMDTLYHGTPAVIKEIVPGIINAVSMMRVITRAYSRQQAVAILLIKFTNRMIVTAKNTIRGPGRLWEQIEDPEALSGLLATLHSCTELNKAYQDEYYRTREGVVGSGGQMSAPGGASVGWGSGSVSAGARGEAQANQQRDLAIFGKFDLFVKRVQKLLDVFTTVQQFQGLARHRMDGMDAHIKRFFDIVDTLRRNSADLLDYTKPAFDKEFMDFSKQIQELEASLQVFINSSFENITSTDNALALLSKFQRILHRPNLRQDLDGKHLVIFHNYGLDLETVQKMYERSKDNPPVPRNMPPVAGTIAWSRQLLRRIEQPMKRFVHNTVILRAQKEARKIIRTYNRVAKALLEFEALWLDAWSRSVQATWEGLRATLLFRAHGRLYVNFDRDVVQLIAECHYLHRMGVPLPPQAQLLLSHRDRHRRNVAELSDILREYESIFQRVIPITRPLLQRNVAALDRLLLPGETSITWTSLTVGDYLARVRNGLGKLSSVVDTVTDIVAHRIQRNQREIANCLLVDLPADESFALDSFVSRQEKISKQNAKLMAVRSVEIENAVESLLATVLFHQDDPAGGAEGEGEGTAEASAEQRKARLVEALHDELFRLRVRYNRLTFKALLIATTNSLSLIKRRIGTRVRRGFLSVEQPFFDVSVELQGDEVVLNPSLEEVQKAINRVVVAVLRASRFVAPWKALGGDPSVSFYDEVARNREIVKVVLLLTSGMHGLRKQVADYLQSYSRYAGLWSQDQQQTYQNFLGGNPTLESFEGELRRFEALQADVASIPASYAIGSLNLETKTIKAQLTDLIEGWKGLFADKLHDVAKQQVEMLENDLDESEKKLQKEITDNLGDLRVVMSTLKHIRQRESQVEFVFGPILDTYQALARSGVEIPKEELDHVSDLRYRWRKLRTLANEKNDEVAGSLQHSFKNDLIVAVEKFKTDVAHFRADFEQNGPMVEGLRPQDAMERLKRYSRMFEDRQRRWEQLKAGEELFGLTVHDYPELRKTQKELQLLDKLYGLYVLVLQKINGYANRLRVDLDFDEITAEVSQFKTACNALPRSVRQWSAFAELHQTISDFSQLQPLLALLSQPSMRDRHWKTLMQLTGANWKLEPDAFRLRDLLDANLHNYSEQIEDIAMASQKELEIEQRKTQIAAEWDALELSFSEFKHRGPIILKGEDMSSIIEQLEESQLALGGMLASRYVAPFREEVTGWLQRLTSVSENLTLWLDVQSSWMYMEAVFAGGDIMKQLPQEAKRFAQIDKQWVKIMTKAAEVKNVVGFCYQNELLNVLPFLRDQLEACQRQLTAYLEAKRNLFPRFYFVSDGVLLEILSQSSDPSAIQPHLVSIFDGLSSVAFEKTKTVDKQTVVRVTHIQSPEGEEVALRQPVVAVGNVEDWLQRLEAEMRSTMREILKEGANECGSILSQPTNVMLAMLQSYVKSYPAQIALLGLQLIWTAECQRTLSAPKADARRAFPECARRIRAVKDDLTEQTRNPELTAFDRINVETLITIQVHQEEVWEGTLARRDRVVTASSFDWLKQARFYWRSERNTLLVCIADAELEYSYEYLGIKERLVVTPLTDRCYITLSQALMLYLGGAPAGPAGTGKTETVKDLGRTLGKYVVVFNCSDQLDFRAMGKIFKGLCQSGAWGCFDEFNRIDLPVLSVIAQQIAVSLAAIKQHKSEFTFTDGQVIKLVPSCGFFITMNPGYAGRQELPENLKVHFRGVSMMVPDRRAIMKVKLAAAGYKENEVLSKKFFMLYQLCEQQLSKQRHYDFGLRNILSVLRTAGAVLRRAVSVNPSQQRDEEMIFMRTVRDMNFSKLVHEDVELFQSLIQDTFPNSKSDRSVNEELEKALAMRIEERGLIAHRPWVDKVVQLYDTKLVRHGIMVVGPAGSGKTRIYDVLLRSLSDIERPHRDYRMNPKAITAPQMFGRLDVVSNDWHDGIFAHLWRKSNKDKQRSVWIICDGPVDAIWIENLNTVLDDNRLLTLANGDRVQMSSTVKMCFEVENLRNASPATVSRAGIIYVSSEELGWKPVVQALLARQVTGDQVAQRRRFVPHVYADTLFELFSNTVDAIGSYVTRECDPVMTVPLQHIVTTAYTTLSPLCVQLQRGPLAEDVGALTRLFWFSLSWAFGGLLENAGRAKLSQYLRQQFQVALPEKDTIFEYFVDLETGEWVHWNVRVERWRYPGDTKLDFSSLFIPTMDSTRMSFLMDLQWQQGQPVLLTGSSGTAKTVTVEQLLKLVCSRDHDDVEERRVWQKKNFSSMTTAGIFQAALEDTLEKRMGSTYGPKRSAKMSLFIDDIAMPEVNAWGDQPTNEIVRQVIEMGGLYSLDRVGEWKTIVDVQYLAAMAHPSGGRNDIPSRLKRHFTVLNLPLPTNEVLDQIYGSVYAGRFPQNGAHIPAAVAQVAAQLTPMTISLWQRISAKLLPTPAKFHYVFNLRDLTRITQGVMLAPVDVVTDPVVLTALWKHEATRVLADRLNNGQDKAWFDHAVRKVIQEHLGDEMATTTDPPAYFVNFLRDPKIDLDTGEQIEAAPFVYEPIESLGSLRERVMGCMRQYNEASRSLKLDLVMFDMALKHVIRICRVLALPRGSAMLVGVGGSGKQSLTRLSSFIQGYKCFQIVATKTYGLTQFFEDLKNMYMHAGPGNKPLTFLFTDNEIKQEAFLEYLNNILASGEVPGLFSSEERDGILNEIRVLARRERPQSWSDEEDWLWGYFIDKVRDNFHVVLCMSPVGEQFRQRARRFPSLISGATLNWFFAWPQEALMDVAMKFLGPFEMQCDAKMKRGIMDVITRLHDRMSEIGEEYFQQFRRHVHTTPRSYLSLLESFMTIYSAKSKEIHDLSKKVTVGLSKLQSAGEDVRDQRIQMNHKEVQLMDAKKDLQTALVEIEQRRGAAQEKQADVSARRDLLDEERSRVEAKKEEATRDLADAEPFLIKAREALDAITPTAIKNIKKMPSPPELFRRIFDGVLIILHEPLIPVKMITDRGKRRLDHSWKQSVKVLSDMKFLDRLQEFNGPRKEEVTDEQCELLAPYLRAEDFNHERAFAVCGNVAGLCTWVRSISNYRQISKRVAPKIQALRQSEGALRIATLKLQQQDEELAVVEGELSRCEGQYDTARTRKQELEDDLFSTKARMEAANNLIDALSGERERWTQQQSQFVEQLRLLPGDVTLACAFMAYCGPYNAEFRQMMYSKVFIDELQKRRVPVTEGLQVTRFLVNEQLISDWAIEGLPNDEHSAQNGCILTSSQKYPLLVDPQEQAVKWLKRRFESRGVVVCQMTDRFFLDQLRDCLQNGLPMIIENVGEDVDPALNPVLDKSITRIGRTLTITVNDKPHEYHEDFFLVLATRHPNPSFSPELYARTTVIDFTVTLRGLESQLLGRVIKREKAELEEERTKLIEEVNSNEKELKYYEDKLLDQLSRSEGNLIDDAELIQTLTVAKRASSDIKEKLTVAADTAKRIDSAREEFRAVAVRGSVLYFSVTEMSLVNSMYQTSLAQFLHLFDSAIDKAEKHPLTQRRIQAIVDTSTMTVFTYINRGLYETHKLLFSLLLAAKIEVRNGKLPHASFLALLRGGAALDIGTSRPKPAAWLSDRVWLNLLAASDVVRAFKGLPDILHRGEAQQAWRAWADSEAPETRKMPDFEDRATTFDRLLLVRCFREDRTMIAAQQYVSDTLGPQYAKSPPVDLKDVVEEMTPLQPTIFLLSQGADPTSHLEGLAKQHKRRINVISMGQGQEASAHAMVSHAWESGEWVLLQNCHLGIPFLHALEERLVSARNTAERQALGLDLDDGKAAAAEAADNKPGAPPAPGKKKDDNKKAKPRIEDDPRNIHADSRLWITAEPSSEFPTGMLQMSVKLTNEPPQGVANGLLRCSTWLSQDTFEAFKRPEWRPLLFSISLLHCVCLERRKFGPLGWNKPYDWNHGDWQASLLFVSNHLTAIGDDLRRGSVSFEAIRYMVSEIQYGGRITDELDRTTFSTLVDRMVTAKITAPEHKYLGGLQMPAVLEDPRHLREYADSLPSNDSPELFGLHPNAEIMYRTAGGNAMLSAILDIQPRGGSGGGAGGVSREEQAVKIADELLRKVPTPWAMDLVRDGQRRLGATQPLVIFLGQEIDRLNVVLRLVRSTLSDLKLAVSGTIIMTQALQDAVDALFDARVPPQWTAVSWPASNLGLWFAAVVQRYEQLNNWIAHDRPPKFWLTGFFNPQGFLTSVKQEVTRMHKAEKWSLDAVTLETTVIARERGDVDRPPAEGVYIHGLFLEGASWDRARHKLREPSPKELYRELPPLHVTAVPLGDSGVGVVKQRAGGARGTGLQKYRCPVYKYPVRRDENLVFEVDLQCEEDPSHWALRGTALLCSMD